MVGLKGNEGNHVKLIPATGLEKLIHIPHFQTNILIQVIAKPPINSISIKYRGLRIQEDLVIR